MNWIAIYKSRWTYFAMRMGFVVALSMVLLWPHSQKTHMVACAVSWITGYTAAMLEKYR